MCVRGECDWSHLVEFEKIKCFFFLVHLNSTTGTCNLTKWRKCACKHSQVRCRLHFLKMIDNMIMIPYCAFCSFSNKPILLFTFIFGYMERQICWQADLIYHVTEKKLAIGCCLCASMVSWFKVHAYWQHEVQWNGFFERKAIFCHLRTWVRVPTLSVS